MPAGIRNRADSSGRSLRPVGGAAVDVDAGVRPSAEKVFAAYAISREGSVRAARGAERERAVRLQDQRDVGVADAGRGAAGPTAGSWPARRGWAAAGRRRAPRAPSGTSSSARASPGRRRWRWRRTDCTLVGDLVVGDPLAEPLRLRAERDLGEQRATSAGGARRTAPTPGRRSPCRRPRDGRPAGSSPSLPHRAGRRVARQQVRPGRGGRVAVVAPAMTAAAQAIAVRARRRPGRGGWVTTLLEKTGRSPIICGRVGPCPGNRSGMTERPSPIDLCPSVEAPVPGGCPAEVEVGVVGAAVVEAAGRGVRSATARARCRAASGRTPAPRHGRGSGVGVRTASRGGVGHKLRPPERTLWRRRDHARTRTSTRKNTHVGTQESTPRRREFGASEGRGGE